MSHDLELEKRLWPTILLGLLEIILPASLALFSPNLALDFFCMCEYGLLALFHGVGICSIEEVICRFLIQTDEDLADTIDTLVADAVNVLVNGARVGKGRSRCKELEEVWWK